MKKIFRLAGIALSFFAVSVLSSCEKDDSKDFDFTLRKKSDMLEFCDDEGL